jgi:hypothetical protein
MNIIKYFSMGFCTGMMIITLINSATKNFHAALVTAVISLTFAILALASS